MLGIGSFLAKIRPIFVRHFAQRIPAFLLAPTALLTRFHGKLPTAVCFWNPRSCLFCRPSLSLALAMSFTVARRPVTLFGRRSLSSLAVLTTATIFGLDFWTFSPQLLYLVFFPFSSSFRSPLSLQHTNLLYSK
jgi:hypothetical protein